MASITSRHIKVILRGIIFITLMIIFNLIYMRPTLTDFFKGRTTIAQSQEVADPQDPVLVICPNPPFKPSFFKEQGIGFDANFWKLSDPRFISIRSKLEMGSSMMNLYKNMSYKLVTDWNISILKGKDGM